MKKLLPFIFAVAASPAYANVTAKYVTSAQISIDSPYVITNAIGGLNLGSLSNGVPAAVNTNKTVTTAGSAFSFSESYQAGDVTQSAITPSSGIATLPVLGGQTTVISGGTAGSLALTNLSSGITTCTAGGSGTSCLASTSVSIEID